MKSMNQIWNDSMVKVSNLLQELNFHGCNMISMDLVTVSKMEDYKDGEFVAAVLATAFGHVEETVRRYKVGPV